MRRACRRTINAVTRAVPPPFGPCLSGVARLSLWRLGLPYWPVCAPPYDHPRVGLSLWGTCTWLSEVEEGPPPTCRLARSGPPGPHWRPQDCGPAPAPGAPRRALWGCACSCRASSRRSRRLSTLRLTVLTPSNNAITHRPAWCAPSIPGRRVGPVRRPRGCARRFHAGSVRLVCCPACRRCLSAVLSRARLTREPSHHRRRR